MSFFFGICKVYVKMPVVLNIAVGSFAVLLVCFTPSNCQACFTQVCFTPKTATSKVDLGVLLLAVLPPKTAKSKTDLAVLLWVKWT